MEKYIKVKFTDEEQKQLQYQAGLQNKKVNTFIHDAAMNIKTEISPVFAAFEVGEKMSGVRDALNKIIAREMKEDLPLYEDDVIELDQRMGEIELAFAEYLRTVRKEL